MKMSTAKCESMVNEAWACTRDAYQRAPKSFREGVMEAIALVTLVGNFEAGMCLSYVVAKLLLQDIYDREGGEADATE